MATGPPRPQGDVGEGAHDTSPMASCSPHTGAGLHGDDMLAAMPDLRWTNAGNINKKLKPSLYEMNVKLYTFLKYSFLKEMNKNKTDKQ